MTSPVRMRRIARIVFSGFMWLPEPRSSAAPHLDGHRWLSAGGRHVCAPARELPRPIETAIPRPITTSLMGCSSLSERGYIEQGGETVAQPFAVGNACGATLPPGGDRHAGPRDGSSERDRAGDVSPARP